LIRELIEGASYGFGEPWKLTADSLAAVVPIFRKFERKRGCLVVQELSKDSISFTDSGQINKVKVALKDVKQPVFVRAGTIFKGQGTQSRASGAGVILEPDKESLVDVFCVHASYGISFHSGFSAMSDLAPRRVEDALMSPSKNQARVWEAAAIRGFRANVSHCPKCGSSSLLQSYESEVVCVHCGNVLPPVRTSHFESQMRRVEGRDELRSPLALRAYSPLASFRDNLVGNLQEMRDFNKQVEDMLSKIPAELENQVGAVFIDSKGVLGLEMFDHPDSWRAFSRSIVRNYADILAKERSGESLFGLRDEMVPQAVKEFLTKARNLSESSIFKNRIGETWMFSGELAGEYTMIGSDVIHLILKRKTDTNRSCFT